MSPRNGSHDGVPASGPPHRGVQESWRGDRGRQVPASGETCRQSGWKQSGWGRSGRKRGRLRALRQQRIRRDPSGGLARKWHSGDGGPQGWTAPASRKGRWPKPSSPPSALSGKASVLCLADHFVPSHPLSKAEAGTGADLPGRNGNNCILFGDQLLPDSPYLGRSYESTPDRCSDWHAIAARLIDYHLDHVPGAEPVCRRNPTFPDPTKTSAEPVAEERAALSHQRGEVETALDERKAQPRGPQIVLPSETSERARHRDESSRSATAC